MAGFVSGAQAYIVANGTKVRPVQILAVSGGLYTLMFLDGHGSTRLKKGRLYRTKEDAERSIKQKKSAGRVLSNPHTQGWNL